MFKNIFGKKQQETPIEMPKKYFVTKDKNSYYNNLTWDDGLLFNINDFTLSLQWELKERK